MAEPAPAGGVGALAGKTIVLVGAGQMGGALLEAWLDGGVEPRFLSVVDPQPAPALLDRLQRHGVTHNPADVGPADVLVLAVKPQALAGATPGLLRHIGTQSLVVSVLAGATVETLRRAFPKAGVIARAMPNTPAAIREGITGVFVEPRASATQRDVVGRLLGAVGAVEWLDDETLVDAVTAVSGSGPAYVFFLAECLARAGEAAGLPPDVAMRLARATVSGAGALLAARPAVSPETLRRNVTSPGGTTAAALDVLAGPDALSRLMHDAVAAAKRRAGELSS